MPSVTPPDPGHEDDTTTPLGAAHAYGAIDMGGGRCVFDIPRGQGWLAIVRDRWIVTPDGDHVLSTVAYDLLRRGSRIPGVANTFACDGATYALVEVEGGAAVELVT